MTWTATHMGTRYAIDASGLLSLVAGALLMAAVAFGLFARTWSFDRASLPRAAGFWVGGTLLCMVPAMIWAFVSAVFLLDGTVLWHFPGLPVGTLAGLGWMGVSGGIVFGIVGLKSWPEGHWPLTLPMLLPAGLAMLLALPAVAQCIHYAGLGQAPLPYIPALTPFHVGRTVAFTGFDPLPDSSWVREPVAPWTADAAGEQKRTMKVAAWGVEVEHDVVREAGLEAGDPMFPLAVGHRWVWVPTIKDAATERVMFSGGRRVTHSHPEDAVSMEITAAEVKDGLRVWTVRVIEANKPPVDTELVAWNGKTVLYENNRPGLTEAVRLHATPDLLDESVSCTGLVFQDFNCQCTVPHDWMVGLAPGPTHCRKRVGAEVGHAIARTITLFATLGMVDPGGKGHTEFMNLVEFTPAPEGAIALDGGWTPPRPHVQKVYEAVVAQTWDRDKAAVAQRSITEDFTCEEVAAVVRPITFDDGKRSAIDALKPKIGDECHVRLMGLLPEPEDTP